MLFFPFCFVFSYYTWTLHCKKMNDAAYVSDEHVKSKLMLDLNKNIPTYVFA